MEKRKPSYDLERFKAVCGDPETLDLTETALLSARRLGFDVDDIAGLIRTMTRRMFYKSMTSYADSRQWQDVYHVPAPSIDATVYLKFTSGTVTEFTVLSFKEKQ
jgi:motility quorum-sensing regulator/GCU-specific mRNA interferase toxin